MSILQNGGNRQIFITCIVSVYKTIVDTKVPVCLPEIPAPLILATQNQFFFIFSCMNVLKSVI